MSLHLIIDGYNLIRQSDQLLAEERKALELGRQSLIDQLASYKRLKGHKVTVVFDGSQKYYFPNAKTTEKGIRIRFSRHGETADAVIKKMAAQERERALVVSADRALTDAASASGATIVSPEAFEEKMAMAQMMEIKGAEPEADDGARGATGTKKKGPSRRLPKAKRKQRRKMKKL